MTTVANNPGEFSITGLNDHTGWFRLATVEDVGFSILGTWVGTIALKISDQDTFLKPRYDTVKTYTTNTGRLCLPRKVGRYFEFEFTAWASGIAYIQLAQGVSSDGNLSDLGPPPTAPRSGGA